MESAINQLNSDSCCPFKFGSFPFHLISIFFAENQAYNTHALARSNGDQGLEKDDSYASLTVELACMCKELH